MKKLKTIGCILLLAVTIQSCQEPIDLDVPGGEPEFVVEAEVTTELDSSYVKLTKTADYYSTDPFPVITDATVSVNGIPFIHMGNGLYKAPSPYIGVAGQVYDLDIVAEGKHLTSSSILEPMFRIDSLFQVFKPAEGFFEEGYSINYMGFDDRSKIKYTYFRLGYFDTIVQRDSIQPFKILFNSNETPVNEVYTFELPFTRFQKGETCVMIFRSATKFMNDFILAYSAQTDGAPGPFQVPPANLPSNIKGGALGYFATYDVVRKRYTVK